MENQRNAHATDTRTTSLRAELILDAPNDSVDETYHGATDIDADDDSAIAHFLDTPLLLKLT